MTKNALSPCPTWHRVRGWVLFAVVAIILESTAQSAVPRVLDGNTPQDRRLGRPKDMNGYFPFVPPTSRAEWETRAERLRQQILVSLGLWPMPTKMPMDPVIYGRIERADYTVEKVYFQSMPGFYVTGNLYRPKGKPGKRPGVLCPHGHWRDGRFHEKTVGDIIKEFNRKAEHFFEGGRSPLQSRCVQLARMGCVVFHFDMIGYADSVQIPDRIAHRFSKQRPEMANPNGWGLFSPQAESHAQSVMGLQTYNSIRALDFISQLQDVDQERLGVTGASGGGTQTFMLCALDQRPAVCFPAVMVSTAMQGGCTCENACNIRVGTGNIAFAALFAPKPLCLSAANDWTKEMRTKGFPELRQLYRMLGASEKVMLVDRTEFGHNYNSVSRHAMYHWFNTHLGIGADEPIQERDYLRLTQAEMTVWGAEHPKPTDSPEFERQLLRWWHEDSERQLEKLTPNDRPTLRRYHEVVGKAMDVIIGNGLPTPADLEFDKRHKEDRGDYLMVTGLLKNESRGQELPTVFLYPDDWGGRVVVWLDKDGKAGLFSNSNEPRPEIHRLLQSGATVVGVDLLHQGEFLTDAKPLKATRVSHNRDTAVYTLGYNHSLFAQRVHDVLAVLSFVKNHDRTPQQINLVGTKGAGHWAAAACSQARGNIDAAAIDTGGFRFGELDDLQNPDFLPGIVKYGDLPAMLALAAPQKLWLAGERRTIPAIVTAAYTAAGAADRLSLWQGGDADITAAAADWIRSCK